MTTSRERWYVWVMFRLVGNCSTEMVAAEGFPLGRFACVSDSFLPPSSRRNLLLFQYTRQESIPSANALETQATPHVDNTDDADSGAVGVALTFRTDLSHIAECWPLLPEHIRAAVLALVNAAAPNPPTSTNEPDHLEHLPWEKKEDR